MAQEYSAEQVQAVARDVLTRIAPGTIVTLEGPLGAGKTTLVKELFAQMGVAEEVTSPTFGYVNSYQAAGGPLHHFDLYRISSVDEFCQAGFEEYLADQEAVCVIEWPAVIAPLLKRYRSVLAIKLAYCPDSLEQRTITIL